MAGDPALRSPSPLPADLDERLRSELGMPFLPTVFVLLADHRSYLRAAADAFLAGLPGALDLDWHGRAVRSIGFAAAASLAPDPWEVGTCAPSIAALIDSYNKVNPPSLLFVLSLSPAPWGRVRVMEPPLPEPPAATDRKALLADIDACHGNFKLPGFWRELVAGWPQQAARAWALVRRLSESGDIARAREAVLSFTLEEAVGGAGLGSARPVPEPLGSSAVPGLRGSSAVPEPSDVGCSPAQAAEIATVLSFYAITIPTMVVEIECLRYALELAAPSAGGASGVPVQ